MPSTTSISTETPPDIKRPTFSNHGIDVEIRETQLLGTCNFDHTASKKSVGSKTKPDRNSSSLEASQSPQTQASQTLVRDGTEKMLSRKVYDLACGKNQVIL